MTWHLEMSLKEEASKLLFPLSPCGPLGNVLSNQEGFIDVPGAHGRRSLAFRND